MDELQDWLAGSPQPAPWHGTFAEYFPLVLRRPELARGSHALLHAAVLAAGPAPDPADQPPADGAASRPPRRYAAFASQVFGIDGVIDEIVRFLHSAGQGLDIRRRILLLVGPPGSAKSTIVAILKRCLEEYTRTDAGAVYGIGGCPMHEDPLHLLQPGARDRLLREKGIRVEGELCPVCAHRLGSDWGGDVAAAPVERVVFSEQGRVGIATFAPSDPNVQDVSDLVGSMDLLALQKWGVESHPLAYRFDGALNVANRGLCEMIEMLKCVGEDAWLFTRQGIRRVGDVVRPFRGQRPDTFAPIALDLAAPGGLRRAVQVYRAGAGPTVRVRTRLGFELEGTPLHRVLALDPSGDIVWKTMGSLGRGDRVCLQRGMERWGAPVVVGAAGLRRDRARRLAAPGRRGVGPAGGRAAAATLPASTRTLLPARPVVGAPLARLLGCFAAGGAWGDGAPVRFALPGGEAEGAAAREIRDAAAALGVRVRRDGRRTLADARLAGLLRRAGAAGPDAPGQGVPWSILRGPRACAVAFLDGFFTASGGPRARCASHDLASGVQMLLLNLGIVAGVAPDGPGSVPSRRGWTIELCAADAAHLRREAQVPGGRDPAGGADPVPVPPAAWRAPGADAARRSEGLAGGAAGALGSRVWADLGAWAAGSAAPGRAEARAACARLEEFHVEAARVRSLLEGPFACDEVAEVIPGFAETWDFEVPSGAAFVSGGLVSHNSKSELLYTFLTLAQERQIKTGRFALISADEVLLAHSNEAEYQRFVADRKNEALQSRSYLVRVPYNLRWSDEVRIYEKLLGESRAPGHLAPWTLRAAAAWALLSRFEKNEKYPPSLKLKLYDGQFEGEYRPAHAAEAREQSPRDGMQGVSPRQVINALSQAVVAAGVPCLDPVAALRALRESLDHHVGEETRQGVEELTANIAAVRKEYDEWALETVSKAFVASFDESAQSLLKKYLDVAEASLRKDKVRDPVTGEWVEPDERFLRGLEDLIGVSEPGRRAFREELLVRVAGALRRGETFRYDSHPRLREAIEKRLFADLQGTIRTTVSSKVPDDEQRRRLDQVLLRLVQHEGFCPHCSQALMRYVAYLLERSA